MISSVEQVLANDLCTGCGACPGLAAPGKVELHISARGQLQPEIRQALTPGEQAAIVAVCPGAVVGHDRGTALETPSEVPVHPTWGPIVSAGQGWASDPDQRRLGSSGGGLTALATYALDHDWADAVVHVGMSDEDPLNAKTWISTTAEQVLSRAGSRYQPASVLDSVQAAVRDHARVLVVGRPCDISALRRLQARDVVVAERVVLALSFFCAGTPTRRGTEVLVERMGVPAEDVAGLRFRGDGWPGLARVTRHDGSSETLSYNESWGAVLGKHLLWRCKVCPDGVGEFADVSCADAWEGGEDGFPSFEEQAGRSLVLARTALGALLVAAAARDGALVREDLAAAEIDGMQPYQLRRRRELLARLVGARLAGRRLPSYRRMRLGQDARRLGPVRQARTVVGTAQRARGSRS
ncbi:MAG: coenzyme F420-reducing hydrogenase subunit beta [Frankiales bacterium]|nr:coenzyme F420-reducing hydrogenase subunit beta [Frankiales bacterium]